MYFKPTFLCLLLFFFATEFSVSAQSAMGGWTLHVPAREAIGVVAHNSTVYAAFAKGVLAYDTDSKEKTLLTSVNGLSDIDISTIGYEPETGTTVVGYKNGNIDLLTDNRTDNLPFIKLAQIQGDKTILRIVSRNGRIYAATGFGVVVIDPKRREIRETFFPTETRENIVDISFSSDSIYVLTRSQVRAAKLNNPALADFNQWSVDTRVPTNALNNYQDLEFINSRQFITKNDTAFGKDSIYQISTNGLSPLSVLPFGLELRSISNTNNKLAINLMGGYFQINNDLNAVEDGINTFAANQFINANSSWWQNGIVYIADAEAGLLEYKPGVSIVPISFDGPPKNSFYNLDWEGGKLAVAGGGLGGKDLTFNNSGMYVLEDNKWSLFSRQNIPALDTSNFFDVLAVSINTKNISEVAMGTYSGTPLSIVNDDQTVRYNFTPDNSPLETSVLGNNATLVSDLQYDENGNLWILNGYCSNTLKVFKADSTWLEFDLGTASKNEFTTKIAIDYNDNVWFAVDGKGLFAFNYNNTLDNPQDDKVAQIVQSSSNENLPSNTIRAIAVDFDNEIWIGTDNGFAILYNSAGIFENTQPQFAPQRIKLDFEGNVEYLLGSTAINDIEIDGGNRKWMATDGSGIFLLSADGLTILANYTEENSPLISNSVLDLEIDHNTGEMYIVTVNGLISLRIDATYEDPEYSDVIVFPNPARPAFDGMITIQGIRFNSDVKVTDIGGNLVFQTTSNGGTAVWNGNNLNGEKVASGVYLIWTAANEGKGRNVGKVVVIND